GTPVAVTPVGALSELVKDHVTGFVLPRNADLSAVLSPTQQASWSRVAVHAQQIVAARYPWQAVAERTQALYAELRSHSLAVAPSS
ncbi:MAG TPA: hypothetical protein VL096_02040, partial [Pirellulaceae bacterium]|nr:hypothetical protein [Pirellulaceae bacterium]